MWGIAGLVLLGLVLSIPATRRRIIQQVIFPAAYRLYTGPLGYWYHRYSVMSSAGDASKKAHSIPGPAQTLGSGAAQFSIRLIPILEDNYCYLLLHAASKTAALVDPADATEVSKALKEHAADFKLTHILTTHKHHDHAGGNIELAQQHPNLVVCGGKGDGVAAVTKEVTTGDSIKMADHFAAEVFQCPCHTRGHVLYKIQDALFTGDTLFAGGCGKFFEGNAKEMYANLYSCIGKLPDHTQIFCGHEYTESNLQFAIWVEPDNQAVKDKLSWSIERRAAKYPTIPTKLSEEKAFNPFMRVHEKSVQQRVSKVIALRSGEGDAAGLSETELGIKTLDALRTLKNENIHKQK